MKNIYYTDDINGDGYAERDAFIRKIQVPHNMTEEKIKQKILEQFNHDEGDYVDSVCFEGGWKYADCTSIYGVDHVKKEIREGLYSDVVSPQHLDVRQEFGIFWIGIDAPLYGLFFKVEEED